MRDEWGRLLALLVAQYRRVDLAEDGLAHAVEAATRTWPRAGVPRNPTGWVLTAARHAIVDRLRSEAVLARRMPLIELEHEVNAAAQRVMADPGDEILDERLRLILLCTQPQLSPPLAAALTLRLVMGVSTADIARLFLVPTPTMAARLTRGRRRLAGGRFVVPDRTELSERIPAVAQIAYLIFTTGYAPGSGADVTRVETAAEAIRLIRILRLSTPRATAELDPLLALMLLQHSRRDARTANGKLVLLADQDRTRWHYNEIGEALGLLTPLVWEPATPHLIQALVAAEHAIAPSPLHTAWDRVVELYDELIALIDSPVVRLNRAVALAESQGPQIGLAALDGVALHGHRLPATRAELLLRAGRAAEAVRAFDSAIARCDNEAERAHLIDMRRVAAGRDNQARE